MNPSFQKEGNPSTMSAKVEPTADNLRQHLTTHVLNHQGSNQAKEQPTKGLSLHTPGTEEPGWERRNPVETTSQAQPRRPSYDLHLTRHRYSWT